MVVRPGRIPASALGLAVCLLSAGAAAAEQSSASEGPREMVPFVIPARVDGKSLIVVPAGAAIAPDGPRLAARDGHFHIGQRRVRIWGVNTCFGANFPTHDDAQRVAERLAAFGVNSVRFHHMDSGGFPNGIWDAKDPTRLSAEALDRLDYFIDQLARRGIYANVNLHVSRTHSAVLKLPDSDKLAGYDKMVDIFTPALIDAQRKYARDLLTHVNAYRKIRYADDPAVAFVELSNEDSLFMWGANKSLPALPPYYAGILQDRHTAWLKARYGSTDGLRQAWDVGAQPLGENLLTEGRNPSSAPATVGATRWVLERHGECAARTVKPTGGGEGVRIEIDKADATNWHIQLNQSGLAVKAGRYYTLSFRARADRPRELAYAVGQAHDPYKGLGLWGQVKLTDRWQEFRAGFTAVADDGNARVNFQAGGTDIAVEIGDVQLRPGGLVGLAKEESVEAGNVAVFAAVETPARTLDRMRFLAETEKAYFDGMREYVKKDLSCKALVTGTIVFGPLGLYAQSDMDYIDGHAYWEHPRFPGKPWDPSNWLVEQKAMTDHPDESPLFRLAPERLAGKPYTVSEYNHAAPNDYQAECVPMIASFAAGQDWDGVWLFAYSHRKDDWDKQAFSGFFDIDGNPSKWGFMPAGAVIFREGGAGTLAAGKVVPLAGSPDVLGDLAKIHLKHDRNLLAAVGEKDKIAWKDLLQTRLYVCLTDKPPAAPPVPGGNEIHMDWKVDPKGKGFYSATGSRAGAWISHTGTDIATRLELGAPEFVAMTFTALDDQPLAKSKKELITVCGRCQNTGMKFSADRRTVGRDWGGPPVMIEAARGLLPGQGIRLAEGIESPITCQPLGPDGRALEEVKPVRPDAGAGYVALPMHSPTMWYLLTR